MLHRYFILTIILRVVVEYVINFRILHIEGVEIGGSATSRGNLWKTDSWALREHLIFFSVACKEG